MEKKNIFNLFLVKFVVVWFVYAECTENYTAECEITKYVKAPFPLEAIVNA